MFFIYHSVSQRIDRENKTIFVSPEHIAMITVNFEKTWNRPPTQEEMNGVVDNYIMDQIFYREATALGLDKTDPAIKRRMRQIMESMLDNFTTVYPSEDQLKQYLSDNADKFRENPIISFEHKYFSYNNKDAAEEIHRKLIENKAYDEAKVEYLSLLPQEFQTESYSNVNKLFGSDFAREVFSLKTNAWTGPVRSAYGWHLVYVEEIIEGNVPELDRIWDLVEREWTVEKKRELKELQYSKMKEKYIIKFKENGE